MQSYPDASACADARIEKLTAALEDLIACFDTGGQTYTIETLGSGGEVTPETVEALEHAMFVLYDEDSEENNSEES